MSNDLPDQYCLRCGIYKSQQHIFHGCTVYSASFKQHFWSPEPTHRCKVCGAYWRLHEEGWSLVSETCGECCDNAVMGDQIEPLTPE